jgi:hypothetical protein
MWIDDYGNYHMGEPPPRPFQPDGGGLTDLSLTFGTLLVAANPAARAGEGLLGTLSNPVANSFYRASAFASRYPDIVEAAVPIAVLAAERISGAEWPASLPDPGWDSKIALLDKGWEVSDKIGEKTQETMNNLQAYVDSHKSPEPNPMWGISCSTCNLNQPVLNIPPSTCH